MKMTDIHTKKSDHDSYWKEFNSGFKEFDNLARTIIAKKWLRELKADFILDIGCGPGYLAKLVKEENPNSKFDGVDFSSEALKHAKQYLHQFWEMDIDFSDIEAADETYDAVLCLECVEHVYDVHHTLCEIKRLLKKTGRGLISVPNLAYWKYRLQLLLGQLPHTEVTDERHLHMFTFGSLKNRLLKAGLKIERAWGYGKKMSYFAYRHFKLLSSTIYIEVSRDDNG